MMRAACPVRARAHHWVIAPWNDSGRPPPGCGIFPCDQSFPSCVTHTEAHAGEKTSDAALPPRCVCRLRPPYAASTVACWYVDMYSAWAEVVKGGTAFISYDTAAPGSEARGGRGEKEPTQSAGCVTQARGRWRGKLSCDNTAEQTPGGVWVARTDPLVELRQIQQEPGLQERERVLPDEALPGVLCAAGGREQSRRVANGRHGLRLLLQGRRRHGDLGFSGLRVELRWDLNLICMRLR